MVAITWHISEDLHVRGREARPIKEPWWKRRIEQDIKEARKVISKLERKKKKMKLEGMIEKWHIWKEEIK